MEETGSKTKKHGNGIGGHLNWKKSKGSEKTKAIMQKVCLCQNCGHSWILDKK